MYFVHRVNTKKWTKDLDFTKKEKEREMTFLKICFQLFLYPVIGIYYALVLSYLWGWFVVPTFNLPELSIQTAWGLYILVGFLNTQIRTTKPKEEDRSNTVTYLEAVLAPTIAWLSGYLIYTFLG